MKLLEALAESNFKIYTNYECNYELILQILTYYNVIAKTCFKKDEGHGPITSKILTNCSPYPAGANWQVLKDEVPVLVGAR